MSDIVERLRNRCDRKYINALCEDAADEIERLRALLRSALPHIHSAVSLDGSSLRDDIRRALEGK